MMGIRTLLQDDGGPRRCLDGLLVASRSQPAGASPTAARCQDARALHRATPRYVFQVPFGAVFVIVIVAGLRSGSGPRMATRSV